MKRATRHLAGILTAATLLVSLGAGTAQADDAAAPSAPAAKTVQAGMRLTFHDTYSSGDMCTLGAVGTDSMNRKVGITSGHCNPISVSDPVKPGQHVINNEHKVWDWRDVSAGPIGWIRWVSADMAGRNPKALIDALDYMVIEFAPHVTLSSDFMTAPKYTYDPGVDYGQDEHENPPHKLKPGTIEVPAQPLGKKINAIYADAAGNPKNPTLGMSVCAAGSTTMQENAFVGQPTAIPCGLVTSGGLYTPAVSLTTGQFSGLAAVQSHDSGGPVVNRSRTNEWVGIITGVTLLANHYTSAKAILDDLNPRGVTGSGFQITNN